VLRIALDEASAKMRTGPPLDTGEDLALGCWAGVIPLRLTAAAPVADPALGAGVAPPRTVSAYRRGAMP
jgi:hypothetical protein